MSDDLPPPPPEDYKYEFYHDDFYQEDDDVPPPPPPREPSELGDSEPSPLDGGWFYAPSKGWIHIQAFSPEEVKAKKAAFLAQYGVNDGNQGDPFRQKLRQYAAKVLHMRAAPSWGNSQRNVNKGTKDKKAVPRVTDGRKSRGRNREVSRTLHLAQVARSSSLPPLTRVRTGKKTRQNRRSVKGSSAAKGKKKQATRLSPRTRSKKIRQLRRHLKQDRQSSLNSIDLESLADKDLMTLYMGAVDHVVAGKDGRFSIGV